MKCPDCNREDYEEMPQLFTDAKLYHCRFCGRSFLSIAVRVYEAPLVFKYLSEIRRKP